MTLIHINIDVIKLKKISSKKHIEKINVAMCVCFRNNNQKIIDAMETMKGKPQPFL